MFGTTIGGIIGVVLKNVSNKLISFILEFAAGLMLAIISFDLIPESIEIANIQTSFMGIVTGIISMIICDSLIKTKFKKLEKNNTLARTGIIIGIGLAIHNFPEGLAIGSGFGVSGILGISLAIVIAMHDIPEGCNQYVM